MKTAAIMLAGLCLLWAGVFGYHRLVAKKSNSDHVGKAMVTKSSDPAASSSTSPIPVQGVDEPEEMRVPPMPTPVLTPPMLMMKAESEKSGWKYDPEHILPTMSRIVERYPDFGDGYLLRIGALCEGNDQKALELDLQNAFDNLKNISSTEHPETMLLSIQALVRYRKADLEGALSDLQRAIEGNPDNALEFSQSGATAPETSAKICVWTLPMLDDMVNQRPNDYRGYMYRGLYYGKFAQSDEKLLARSFEDLKKARSLRPDSALPDYFMAAVFNKAYWLKHWGLSQLGQGKFNQELIQALDRSLEKNPRLLPALKMRAEAEWELKQPAKTVEDYDRVIELDPKDGSAFNDRALAKVELGKTYDAISDFDSAIRVKPRDLNNSISYESRADAFMKTNQYERAAHDITTALSLQVGGILILSNIHQFRALYPEYDRASDAAVALKLQQTFYPQMTYENFSQGFLGNNKFWTSTAIPDLYMKRSDAYLRNGQWRNASIDYQRATAGFPDYAKYIERWRPIGGFGGMENLLDLKTFEVASDGSRKFWIKRTKESTGAPSTVERYELKCNERQIRALSSVSYNGAGTLTSSHEGGQWEGVIPDSLGEMLMEGACH